MMVQKTHFYDFVLRPKTLSQNLVRDVRPGKTVAIEADTSLREFIDMHRQRGREITQDAFDRVSRNAPDAEETKYVIDPKCIKIMSHLLEALPPPPKAILLH